MFRRSKQGAVHVITGGDPLSGDHLQSLQQSLQECLRDAPPRAVVDLQSVPLVDSAGLEFLLDALDRFTARAGTLKLAAPNPLCRDILNITGVGSQFDVYPEVKSAVGSFRQ